MNHITAEPLLDPFMDSALDAETRWAVAAHLAACPTCQATLTHRAQVRRLVRQRASQVHAPPDLARRIRLALPVAEPAPRWVWPRPLVALSMGLVALAFVLVALVANRPVAPSPDLAAQLAAQHTLFAHDDDLLEVSGDGAVEWLQARVAFPVVAPDVPGYEFQGGRLAALEGQRAVQLIYEQEATKRYVTLLLFDPLGPLARLRRPNAPPLVEQRGQAAVLAWSGQNTRVALVSEMSVADLQRLAAQIFPPP